MIANASVGDYLSIMHSWSTSAPVRSFAPVPPVYSCDLILLPSIRLVSRPRDMYRWSGNGTKCMGCEASHLFQADALRKCRNSANHAPATKIWLFVCSRPKGLVSTRLFVSGVGCVDSSLSPGFYWIRSCSIARVPFVCQRTTNHGRTRAESNDKVVMFLEVVVTVD